jgi:hypothetical protein
LFEEKEKTMISPERKEMHLGLHKILAGFLCFITFFAAAVSAAPYKHLLHASEQHAPVQNVHYSTRRRQLSALDDLENYFWHGSRTAIGAPLGRRIEFMSRCVRECDSMGYACAGFSIETQTDFCTLVGRGSGLKQAAESDFYRKKEVPSATTWEIHDQRMVNNPSLHAWRPVNGTVRYIQNLCAADSMCQGFYTCSNTVNNTELAIAIDPTLGQLRI